MLSLQKRTAGNAYTYPTRQVAALDTTERGHFGLADYHSHRGEAPARVGGPAGGAAPANGHLNGTIAPPRLDAAPDAVHPILRDGLPNRNEPTC